ncbi:uncharacterized protein LOC130735945 [Lotus japonicus]|uniref:uncharacterized protein LOC130735945 n=1 Tax=Lotus japonicus TaxID=34305 RepID=UPI0025885D13|nr:uncharacterized protein LOC130735945 [Lotus japonicus]
MEVVSTAGLLKTVKDLGRCFDKLVREFIVNIPADCDDASSTEYRKVFVRGKCINFSPEVINEFLGRSPVVVAQGEPDLNRVATTLTGKLVRKWPKKGLLPSGRLTAKYVVLYKIGTANWMATNHLSGVTPPLARMLYLVGTGEIIAHQQPTIVRADESHDIVLSATKGTANASGTKAVGSSKEDILAELKAVSKSLGDTIQACKVRKLNVDQLIKAMSDVATAAAEKESEEEGAEVVAGEEADAETEEDLTSVDSSAFCYCGLTSGRTSVCECQNFSFVLSPFAKPFNREMSRIVETPKQGIRAIEGRKDGIDTM